MRYWFSAHKLELLAYDWHCRALPHLKPDERIVVVGMDDKSLERLQLRSYPLPRKMHAQAVDVLREAGARVIGFDVMFKGDSPDDEVFAAALKRTGKVVVPLYPTIRIADGEEKVTFAESPKLLRSYILASSILVPRRFGKVRWFLPYPVDAETTKRYPHLSIALAASYFGDANKSPLVRDTFILGRINAPIGKEGEILIRYAGPPGTFQHVLYHEVLDGTWKRARGANFFRDKIVLIGVIDPLVDQQDTPLGQMQGVEILAHATQTVLQGRWLRHWSESANYAVKSLLCLLLAVAVWKAGLRRAWLFALIEALLWTMTSHQLFIRTGVWADTVEPLGALAVTFIVAAVYETARMRRVFHRFMPSWVAERMLHAQAHEAPQTAEREVTVVFCDVRNYTSLSETLPSETTEEILRRYFIAGEETANRLGTELDKFVGDEIMLYFGEKRGMERHALRAVRWAWEMQAAAQRIHDSGIAGDIGFRIGVGICTGVVRVGTVGAKTRIQPTVIGDAVNTASRLQGITKEVGRGIVMSESTFAQVKDWVEAELVGEVSVKGKQEALKVYCPLRMTVE